MTTTVTEAKLIQDAHALSESLMELIRVVQFRDRDRACCYDISVSQCYALKAVNDHGALTVNDLAGQLYLDKSTASRVANGLEERGLLVRERDPEDGRVIRLRATNEGSELCRKIENDLAEEYAELLEDFDPEVRAAMTRLLGRLANCFAARVEVSNGSCCSIR